MNEKEYAYYVTGSTVMNVLKEGKAEELRLALIVQEEGEDLSYHGSPFYETVTTLTDVETRKKFVHHSHAIASHVDFVRCDQLKNVLESEKVRIDHQIEDYKKEITRLMVQKDRLETAGKEILETGMVQKQASVLKMG